LLPASGELAPVPCGDWTSTRPQKKARGEPRIGSNYTGAERDGQGAGHAKASARLQKKARGKPGLGPTAQVQG
jgi:hypothetical protein